MATRRCIWPPGIWRASCGRVRRADARQGVEGALAALGTGDARQGRASSTLAGRLVRIRL